MRRILGLVAGAVAIASCTGTASPPMTTQTAVSKTTTPAPDTSAPDTPATDISAPDTPAPSAAGPPKDRFEFDCGIGCNDSYTGLVGTDITAGLWQWTPESAETCVYIAVAPHPWLPEGAGDNTVESLWWLDARSPIVLTDREAVVGFAPAADHLQLVIATAPPRCVLERVGSFTTSVDIYEHRHESGYDNATPNLNAGTSDAGTSDAETSDAEWTCHSHAGPEPVTELDWVVPSTEEHPDVSCVVGEGIAAGWWQWRNPSDTCKYLVTEDADVTDHQLVRRRDATEPLLLTEGESVWGYAESPENFAPFTVSSTLSSCTLEYIGPE